MSKAADPYYNRKPVPNQFIEDVGYTGLTASDEFNNRERKYSTAGGGDVRSHSTAKVNGKADPYYQRKQVPNSMINGIGETGLSKEEEYLNRERKFSVGGSDVRKFSDNAHSSGWHPTNDPYYGRQQVPKPSIAGVGDTQMTPVEEYQIRERKESLVNFSDDPFQQIRGEGTRQSISGIGGPAAAAAARRRSSAVAPNVASPLHHHSGYDGDAKLTTVESRRDDDEITPSSSATGAVGATPVFTNPMTSGAASSSATGAVGASSVFTNPMTSAAASSVDPASTLGVRDGTGHHTGETGHTMYYDAATRDLDDVAPHERV